MDTPALTAGSNSLLFPRERSRTARRGARLGMAAVLALAALLAAGCGQVNVRPAQVRRLHDSEPLRGQKELSVTTKLAAGRLTLDQADPGQLYALDTEWDAANMSRTVRCKTAGGTATLTAVIEGQTLSTEHTRMGLSLAGGLPLDLRFETGAGENKLDLTGLNVRRLILQQGAGEVKLWADSPQADPCQALEASSGVGEMQLRGLSNLAPAEIDFKGGIGHALLDFSGEGTRNMRAHLAVGIGQIEVLLPRRLGVRLDLEGNTSGIQVSDQDFRKVGNTYTSNKYAGAPQRLELTVAAGLGGASIRYAD